MNEETAARVSLQLVGKRVTVTTRDWHTVTLTGVLIRASVGCAGAVSKPGAIILRIDGERDRIVFLNHIKSIVEAPTES